MYTEISKKAIFERFDNHKLIFCGDIGYQLPTFEGELLLLMNLIKYLTILLTTVLNVKSYRNCMI